MTKGKKPKFEEALKRLEEIVSMMEDEKLPLDEALARYEEGIKLARYCTKTLDEAERKIEILSKGDDGSVETRPFLPEGDGEASLRKNSPAKKGRGTGEEQFLF